MTVSRLMDFHTTQHLTLAARSNEADNALSMMISRLRDPLPDEAIDNYLEQLHNQLKTPLTHKDHIRILTKLQQHLASVISCAEKERLDTGIANYRENPEKHIALIRDIKQLADNYNLHDLTRQTYINPTPAEIALRFRTQ